VTYAQQGSYTNAIAQFNRVETTLSNTGFTKFIESLYMSGQIDTLIETYEKYTASSLTPPLETKLVYALSKTRLSKEDKYISELATSLTESNKESLIGYLIQATANYQTTQDISSYLEGLKKATTKYPEYVNNWFYLHILSSIATAQTDHAYAADILKALLSLRPLDDKIRLFIAQELVRANKLSEAEVEVDKILRVFDNQPLANLLKAIILAAKNDLNAAKIHIERAINAGFETFNNYLLAGEINFLLNNYEQAISQLEKGLQGGTIRNRYYDMLIYARASTNNEKNIIDSIDKASITNMGQISNISSLLAGLNNSGKSASIASVVNNLTVAADADPIIALETSVFKIASSYDTAFPESIAASKLVLDRYQRGASDYTQAQIFAAKRFFLGELFEQERYEDAKNLSQRGCKLIMITHPTDYF